MKKWQWVTERTKGPGWQMQFRCWSPWGTGVPAWVFESASKPVACASLTSCGNPFYFRAYSLSIHIIAINGPQVEMRVGLVLYLFYRLNKWLSQNHFYFRHLHALGFPFDPLMDKEHYKKAAAYQGLCKPSIHTDPCRTCAVQYHELDWD